MQLDAILRDFDLALPELWARGRVIEARLGELITRDAQLKLHSITLRVKRRESLAGKLARPDRTYGGLWDVTDLVGLRVITYFEDGVDRVGELIESMLPVDFTSSIDKRRERGASEFGYRSLHYVCRLGADGDSPLPREARFEIQVRTMLEHAWAEIEHDLGYKTREAVPVVARRRLSRLAGLLELADQEFVAIRSELEGYAAALPQRIADDADSIPVDRLSFDALLDCPEAQGLDRDIAHALDKPLGREPFFPDYLLRMLATSNLATVAAVRDGLVHHRATILAMVRPYFAFTTATWRLSPESMEELPRGYSLFFLAHATVLAARTLGISKVERLAHLYRAVDYPDDEGSAHRVASHLVDAFRGEERPSAPTTPGT